MSDSMSNVEIEDVLSSIRRLVAEGDKIKKEKKREYGDLSSPAERLVLTSAHRVEDSEVSHTELRASDAEPETSDLDAADQKDGADKENERVETLEIFVGEPHAVNDLEPVEADNNSGEDQAPNNVQPLVLKNENAASPRESLEATIAALEAAVEGDPSEFEPDGSEVSSTPSWGDAPIAAFNSRRDDDQPDDAPAETARHSVQDQIETSGQPQTAEAESPKVLGPESRIFRVIPDTPPEDEVRGIHASRKESEETASPIQQESFDEDFGDEMIGGETRELASDDNFEAALSENILMDEELMRKVVSEVLKGELEGRLGDTITRNVRKLVRREIHRVLTHQELE